MEFHLGVTLEVFPLTSLYPALELQDLYVFKRQMLFTFF